MHLLNQSSSENYELSYWRHRNDEIDFVLDNGKKIIGIEVKSGSGNIRSGLEVFRKTFNPDKILIVGKEGISWTEFISINPGELF